MAPPQQEPCTNALSELEQMFAWPGPHAFVETVAYRRQGIHQALDKALGLADAGAQD